MSNIVPLLNLTAQYETLSKELDEAVLSVLRSGNYILGQHVKRLEESVAKLSGCDHGIAVANGTDALILALWAFDIGPGDEVITTPFTFAATVEAILLRGATPIFVDVDRVSFNINPAMIEAKITPRTKAILPVHLYGLPSDMDPIVKLAQRYGLKVIEDNAQAIGATYKGRPTGSFGDASCISFYPTKNLGAAGDAGMIVTKHADIAERIRALRAHGMRQRYFHDELGVNSRLDELQAVILATKLPHLNNWSQRRQYLADLYTKQLQNCPNLVTPTISIASQPASPVVQATHVWHQYTIRIINAKEHGITRDVVSKELAEKGIGSMCYYPVPLHMQKAFPNTGARGDYPVTEQLADEVLSLPMYPELTEAQVQIVTQTLQAILEKSATPSVPVMQPTSPTLA